MIYVECYSDTTLVRALTSVPPRGVIHAFKGKSGVAERLQNQRDAQGLVDEDPGSSPPRYFRSLQTQDEFEESGLRLLQDLARNNLVVVLRPRLEEWIVRAANDAHVTLDRYGLPENPRALHRVINLDLRKFQRLVQDLRNSDRLQALRRLLNQ